MPLFETAGGLDTTPPLPLCVCPLPDMDWTPISFRLGNAPDSITQLDQANQIGLKQVESKVELRRYMVQRQQEQSG